MHTLFKVVMETLLQEYECQWMHSRVLCRFLVDVEDFYVPPASLCHTLSLPPTNCVELLLINAEPMTKLFAYVTPVLGFNRSYTEAVTEHGVQGRTAQLDLSREPV